MAAVQQQERALAISGGTVAMSEHNVTAFNLELSSLPHNTTSTSRKELTYAGDDRSKPAQSVVIEIARSVEQIRAAASSIAAAHESASVSSSANSS